MKVHGSTLGAVAPDVEISHSTCRTSPEKFTSCPCARESDAHTDACPTTGQTADARIPRRSLSDVALAAMFATEVEQLRRAELMAAIRAERQHLGGIA